jgi:hypothetical protein
MNSSPTPRAGRRLHFSRDRVSVKKPFARAIGLDTVVGILKKNRKNGEGHRALGSPRALHWCNDAYCSAPNVVANT